MRFALAVIAALANAAGPWLCCCAMMAVMSHAKPVRAETPIPAKCSHCKEEPATQSESPTRTAPEPAKPCPCKERLPVLPSATPAATDAGLALDTIAAGLNALGESVAIVSTTTPAPAEVCGLPFMTAETRLRVHHVMHC